MTTSTIPARRRRWYTLSLRALMILVLVVGGGFGWTVNRANRRRWNVEAITSAWKGGVTYDYQFKDGKFNAAGKPWPPAWLGKLLGEEFFHDVTIIRLDLSKVDAKTADAATTAMRQFDRLERLRLIDPPRGTTISGLGRLKQLMVTVTSPVGDQPIRVSSLALLEEVRLDGKGVNDSVLPDLAALPSLRDLLLSNTSITDNGLAPLGGLAKLESLWLGASYVTDSGLPRLAGLKGLTILCLDGDPGVSDEGVEYLSKNLPGLTNLMVGDTQVTDAGLAHLAGFTRLEGFQIAGQAAKITDAGVAQLGRLPHLEALNLAGSGLTDAGLEKLRSLKHLRWLNLSDTAVSDTGIKHLSQVKSLRVLMLDNTAVADVGVGYLPELATLENLYLDGTRVTDAGVKHLYGIKSLKHLFMRNVDVSPEGVAGLKAALPPATVVRTGTIPIRRPVAAVSGAR